MSDPNFSESNFDTAVGCLNKQTYLKESIKAGAKLLVQTKDLNKAFDAEKKQLEEQIVAIQNKLNHLERSHNDKLAKITQNPDYLTVGALKRLQQSLRNLENRMDILSGFDFPDDD